MNCSGCDTTALYHAWGLLEAKGGRREVAGDIFRRGVELGLQNKEVLGVGVGVGFLLHSLGMLLLDDRDWPGAQEVFRRGVKLFPAHSHMLLGMALVMMRTGDHRAARKYFRQSVDADSMHLHAWQSWAVAEKQLGNVELARMLFRQVAVIIIE